MSQVSDVSLKYQDSRYFNFFSFVAGTDTHNEELVFGLRYQVYCLERGFLPADDYPDGLERDEYDEFSTHIAAVNHSGLVVGSLRIVYPPDGIPFPFQQHCTRLFPGNIYPPSRDCIEISRLVISKVYRRRADDTPLGFSSKLLEETSIQSVPVPSQEEGGGRRKLHPEILMGLIREMYRQCKQLGVGYWYVAMESSLARLLQRIHFAFEPIGEVEDYYGPVAPYILSIARFEADIRLKSPDMYEWFQSALDNCPDAG